MYYYCVQLAKIYSKTGYPAEVGALFTMVSSIRVIVGLALWLVSRDSVK